MSDILFLPSISKLLSIKYLLHFHPPMLVAISRYNYVDGKHLHAGQLSSNYKDVM